LRTKRQKHGNLEFELALESLKGKILKVGWVTEKFYPPKKRVTYENNKKVVTLKPSNFTTAAVGYIAEFGSLKRNIPPRPIMTPTNKEQKGNWKKIIENEVKKIFKEEQTVEGALETFGLRVAGDYRAKITSIQEPPLKESTVKARMRERNLGRKNKITQATATFRKPLVFDGIFLNSLTHSVETEK
jgi:hypothetical protein